MVVLGRFPRESPALERRHDAAHNLGTKQILSHPVHMSLRMRLGGLSGADGHTGGGDANASMYIRLPACTTACLAHQARRHEVLLKVMRGADTKYCSTSFCCCFCTCAHPWRQFRRSILCRCPCDQLDNAADQHLQRYWPAPRRESWRTAGDEQKLARSACRHMWQLIGVSALLVLNTIVRSACTYIQ